MMANKILTFADSGVLISAARGNTINSQKALNVLADPDREFCTSEFVELETRPKAIFYRQFGGESLYYEAFFNSVALWAKINQKLAHDAFQLAKNYGMGAMDALHVAAAIELDADELITTEGKTKPMHRIREIKVIEL